MTNNDVIIPRGIIVEVFGSTGIGKTDLVLSWIRDLQEKNLCVFVDTDYKFTVDQAKRHSLGDNVIILQNNIAEDVFDTITKYVDNGADFVVLDSTASLIPAAFVTAPVEEISYKDKAKALRFGLQCIMPSLTRNNATLILVSHERFSPEGISYTTGGKAASLYAALRLKVFADGNIAIVKNRTDPVLTLLQKEEISYDPIGTRQRLLP